MPQLGIPCPRNASLNAPANRTVCFDVVAVAAAAKGIVGLVVKRDVEHRAEVEIETEHPEQSSGDTAMPPNELDVALLAQLLRVRRFVADQTQPRNAPAFLVDGDDRLNRAQVAQVVDQLPQLSRAFDVAPKDNEPTRLHPSKKRRRPRIEFGSGHAGKDQLTR